MDNIVDMSEMKPLCKLCRVRHWTYDRHGEAKPTERLEMAGEKSRGEIARFYFGRGLTPGLAEPLREQAGVTSSESTTRKRGRPRKWAGEAEKKAAYRARVRGKKA